MPQSSQSRGNGHHHRRPDQRKQQGRKRSQPKALDELRPAFAGRHRDEMNRLWARLEDFMIKPTSPSEKAIQFNTARAYRISFVEAFNRTADWVERGMSMNTKEEVIQLLDEIEIFKRNYQGMEQHVSELRIMTKMQKFLEVHVLRSLEQEKEVARKENLGGKGRAETPIVEGCIVPHEKRASRGSSSSSPQSASQVKVEEGQESESDSETESEDEEMDLRQRVRDLTRQVEEMTEKTQKMKGQRDRAREKASRRKVELGEMAEEKEALEAQVKQLEDEKEALQSSEVKLADKVEKKRKKIEALKEQVKESKEETAEAQRELEPATREGASTAESSVLPSAMEDMKRSYEKKLGRLYIQIGQLLADKTELQEQLEKAKAQDKPMARVAILPPPPSSSSPSLLCLPVDTPGEDKDMVAVVTEQEHEQEQGSRRKRSRGPSMDESHEKNSRRRMEDGDEVGVKQAGDVESVPNAMEPTSHGVAAAELPTQDSPPPLTRQHEASTSSSPRRRPDRPNRWDQRPSDMAVQGATNHPLS